VVFADYFYVTQHVQQLVTSSAQTNYALQVLRCHGLSNAALQLVYRATVVARLTYAVCAWRGLTKTSDRHRINSVIDRGRRLGYCLPDLPTFDELCDIADDVLWSNHVLHTLQPPLSIAFTTLQPQTPSSLPTVSRTLNTLNYPTVTLLHACYVRTHIRFFFHNTRIFIHSLLHTCIDLTFYFLAYLHFTAIHSICYNCVLSIHSFIY